MNRNPEPRGPGISRLQAGEEVNHAIENTRRGHELFSRVRENKELVVYELRKEGA